MSYFNSPFLKGDGVRWADVMNSGNHEEAEGRVEVVVHAVHRRQHIFLENKAGLY